MELNQIVWYSLALGVVIFSLIFTISFFASKFKRKPLPYTNRESFNRMDRTNLVHAARALRSNPSRVLYVNHHEDIKTHSLDYVDKRELTENARMANKRTALSTTARYTVLNERNVQPDHRMNYTRGLGTTGANYL